MAEFNPSTYKLPQDALEKLTKFYGRRITVHMDSGTTYSRFLRHVINYNTLLMTETFKRKPDRSLTVMGKFEIPTADVFKVCLFISCKCNQPSSISSSTSSAMESVEDSEQSVVIHDFDVAMESDQTTETASVTDDSGLPGSQATLVGFGSGETVLPEETTNTGNTDNLSVNLDTEETDSNE